MSSNYKSLWSNEMNYLLYINSWSLLLSPISQHNKTNCRLLLLLLLLQSLQWVNPILSLTQPSMTWSVTLITFTAIVTARSGVSYTTHIPNCVVTISHSSIWEYELTGVGNSFPRYFDFLYNFWLPGGWHSHMRKHRGDGGDASPPEFVVGGRQCYSSPPQILASWTYVV